MYVCCTTYKSFAESYSGGKWVGNIPKRHDKIVRPSSKQGSYNVVMFLPLLTPLAGTSLALL
jgi:hypothetical protein